MEVTNFLNPSIHPTQRDIPMVFLQNGSCSGDGADMLTDEATAGTVLKERAKFAQLQASVRVPKVCILTFFNQPVSPITILMR